MFWLVWLAVIVILVVVIFANSKKLLTRQEPRRPEGGSEDPREILEDRYRSGDISEKEYKARKREMGGW